MKTIQEKNKSRHKPTVMKSTEQSRYTSMLLVTHSKSSQQTIV